MARIDMEKKLMCSLCQFSKERYMITKKTHENYLGSFLEILRERFWMDFRDLEGDISDREVVISRLRDVFPDFSSSMRKNREYARKKTSTSWAHIRTSAAHIYRCFGLYEMADEIRKIQNPSNVNDRKKRPEAKTRKRWIEPAELNALIENRRSADDMDSWSILTILSKLGVRPCEVCSIEILGRDSDSGKLKLFIESSKKTEKGKIDSSLSRGLDRGVEFDYSDELVEAIHHWSGVRRGLELDRRINSSRARVSRVCKKMFPDWDQKFCFYTLRYEMGSALKEKYEDDLDGCKMVAAGLGQKCTASASRYGNIHIGRSFKGLKAAVEPSRDAIKSVKDNRSKLVRRESRIDAAEAILKAELEGLIKNDPKVPKKERAQKRKEIMQRYYRNKFGDGDDGPGF